MSISELKTILNKNYRPTMVVLVILCGVIWTVVGAVGKFAEMVDARARTILETASVKPIAEHKEYDRHLTEHDRQIAGLIENAHLMDKNITRLLTIADEHQRKLGSVPAMPATFQRPQ